MMTKTQLGLAVAVSVTLVSAITGTVSARSLSAGPAVQPGDCKQTAQVGVAASPAAAQQMWTAVVIGKFGKNWAEWVGAKDKVVVPINNGGLYQAVAKPCFYYPEP